MKNDRVIYELTSLYDKGDLNAGIDLLRCFNYGAFICDYRDGATYEALSFKSLGVKKGVTLYNDLIKSFKLLSKDEKKDKENSIKGIDKELKQSDKKINNILKGVASKTRVPLDTNEVKLQSQLENEIISKYGFNFAHLSSVQLKTTDVVY